MKHHRSGQGGRIVLCAFWAITIALSLSSQASAAPPTIMLHGSGSTFVNPILSKWAQDFVDDYHTGGRVKIVYDSIGSGAGITQIMAGKVDFAASDRPLPPSQLAKAGLGQFPLVVGGVVPVVNIAGVAPGKIRFTGPLLADIYLGKVKRWNDPEIVRLNPKLALPNTNIAVIHRSDGSGTTFNWVDYFCKISPEWNAAVGEGTTVNWPVGVGANGSDGVSASVRHTPNSIGYVELTYVTQNHLAWGWVKNRAGFFIAPSPASFAAAVEGANWDSASDFYLIVTDAPGAQSYPITATTFILAPRHPAAFSLPKAVALRRLFEWALFLGQPEARALGYVPLPKALALRISLYWNNKFEQ